MKKKSRILVATDYSDAAINAGRYAVQFAESICAELCFIHVYEMTMSSIPTEPLEFSRARIGLSQGELKTLEQHCSNLFASMNRSKNKTGCECVVREGRVANEISEEAKKTEADFIVVGTHGASGIFEKTFGTHAWQIMEKSSVPVLAIPTDGMFRGIKKIAFATAERKTEFPVMNFLVRLAKEFGAEITALHVTNFPVSKRYEATAFKKFREEVQENVPYEKLHLKLGYNENIVDGLNNFCMRTKADWLVLSAEKNTLLKKIFRPGSGAAKKISARTLTPLLCIPELYKPEHSSSWNLITEDENYQEEE